jgi:uroporphyrinogen-III decarboxylase
MENKEEPLQVLHASYYPVRDSLKISELWFNFLPSWWNRGYGITYGERFVFDPDYRTECYRFFDKTLFERFPGCALGERDAKPKVTSPDFGNAVTPAVAGCEVQFPVDNYPWNRHLQREQVRELVPPEDPLVRFPYSEIVSQLAYLNGKLNVDVKPYLPTRGILNDAELILGEDVFADMINAPQDAHRLFTYLLSLYAANMKINCEKFGYRSNVILTNCAIMMISPQMYETVLMDYDRKMWDSSSRQRLGFMIHHCGLIDKYLDSYRKLGRIEMLEIGWGSDLRTAMKIFPETKFSYIFNPTFLMRSTRHQIRDKIKEIFDAARGNLPRLILAMADVEHGTPDENIAEMVECCRKGFD